VPFDPTELNGVAASLIASGTGEAKLRTAIGRLYYAAHLAARERLRSRGWRPTGKGRDHALVIGELATRHFRKESDQLAYLKELREHADYHLESRQTPLNQNCKLCSELRKIGPASSAVTLWHWQEAIDTSNHVFPKLRKL
jgi:hypothetical protein